MLVTELAVAPSPLAALASLRRATASHGKPGPAAFCGDWLGYDAVIAPSIVIAADVVPADNSSQYWCGAYAFPDRLDESSLPARVGGHTDAILVYQNDSWHWLSASKSPCPEWITTALTNACDHHEPWSITWTPPERAPYDRAIADCLAAIAAGEMYQACICTRFTGTFTGAPCDMFVDGVGAMQPAKSAYLHGDWGSLVSFSPETYLRRTGEIVTSHPIKGTLALTGDPHQLRACVKDVAENIMIVDLVRNDLGRLADPGSVRATELLRTRRAPGVWHLVSTVQAQISPQVTIAELLDATFPPASVTGTPKIAARSHIAQWEQSARGFYCGAIGIVAPDADADFNVGIRTVEITAGGSAEFGVGGGITIDSTAAGEWQECWDKAARIIALSDASHS